MDFSYRRPAGKFNYLSAGRGGDNPGQIADHPAAKRQERGAAVQSRAYQLTAQAGRLVQGVLESGEHLKAERARILDTNNTRSLLELTLAEGRNREVRRLLGALGLQVERLVRTRIGRISLGDLPAGRWRTLTETEIKSLLAQR